MKRARGRNTKSNYDEIDVPEILKYRQSTTNNKEYYKKKNTSSSNKNRASKVSKKKTKKNRSKFFLVLIMIVLALFLIFMGTNWNDSDETGALIPVDMDKGKINVLVLGVDKEGLRTDAMMLVSYDMKNTKAELLSIPRDTQIKVTDRKVTRKINEIHAMHDSDNNLLGPLGSIKAVTAITSVPIHYYIEFSFDAIDELADALGPIEFDVPDIEGNGKGMNYDDPTQDLHIHLKPGLQKLKGNQVQQFLRYRKSNNGKGDGSDLSRVKRQQEFLKAAVDQKVNLGLIAKIPSIYSKLKKNIKTNFSAADAVKYAKYLNGLKGENITTHNLPGDSKSTSAGWYFICDLNKTAEFINTYFGYEASGLTNKIAVNDIDGTKKILSSNSGKDSKKNNDTDSTKDSKKNDDVDLDNSVSTKEPEENEDIGNIEDTTSNEIEYNDETAESLEPEQNDIEAKTEVIIPKQSNAPLKIPASTYEDTSSKKESTQQQETLEEEIITLE